MKLIIPDNCDPNLLNMVSGLIKKPSQHVIGEIYGKPTKNKHLGSGRKNIFFGDLAREEMIKRVNAFAELGVDYDYTLNGILPSARVLVNREKIIEELVWLESSPIKTITVANYELARLAEKYCPSVKVVVSFFCGVDNEKKLRQWARLKNIKAVITDRNTYRNIPLLKRLVEIGREYGIGIRVIANLGCMSDCMRTEEHAIMKDISSLGGEMERIHAPCTFYCMRYLLENPEEFLQLPIIRPEDLSIYENIGIEGVKLVDRTQTTPWIERVVGYYLDGSYDGNILDLTCNFTTFNLERKTNAQVEQINITEVIKSREEVLKYRELLPELMQISINHKHNLLACNNTCESCAKKCKNISTVKYNNKRRVMVLKQLNKLEEEYLFT